MILRKRMVPLVLAGVLGLLGPASAAMGQTIVVTAKSLKDLAGDLEYLVKAVAPEGDANVENILGAMKQFQAGDLVKGLDQSRGLGLAVTLPQDFPAGGPPSIVAAVPVTDLNAFLDSIRGLGVAVDDRAGVPGFSHRVTAPDGNTNLFVLQSKGYALFSLVPDGADKLKAIDPASWAPKGRPAVLAAKIRLAELPQALKDQFLEQFKAQMAQQDAQKPDEGPAEYQGRIAAQKLGEESIATLIRDGESVALALDLDRETSEMSLDLAVAGKPGTELAKALGNFRSRRSRFQSMAGGGPLGAWASMPVSRALRENFARGFDEAQKKNPPPVKTPEERALVNRLVELFKTNFDMDDFDGAVGFRRAAGDGSSHHVSLVGLKVRDGKAFDAWFREAVTKIKPKGEEVKVTLDAAKLADGTAIHELAPTFTQDDKNFTRVFGTKPTVSFAFTGDAIMGAFGEDSTAELRKAAAATSVPPSPDAGPAEPVAIFARLSGFDAFVNTEKEQAAYKQAAAEAFRGDDARRDRLRLSLLGEGNAVRLRLSLDVPALKFLAKVGAAMKQR